MKAQTLLRRFEFFYDYCALYEKESGWSVQESSLEEQDEVGEGRGCHGEEHTLGGKEGIT